FQLVAGRIDLQSVRDERPAVDVVGVQRFDAHDLSLGNLCQDLGVQLGVALSDYLAGRRVHDSLGGSATQDVVQWHFQLLDPGLFQLIDVASRNTTALLNDHLA